MLRTRGTGRSAVQTRQRFGAPPVSRCPPSSNPAGSAGNGARMTPCPQTHGRTRGTWPPCRPAGPAVPGGRAHCWWCEQLALVGSSSDQTETEPFIFFILPPLPPFCPRPCPRPLNRPQTRAVAGFPADSGPVAPVPPSGRARRPNLHRASAAAAARPGGQHRPLLFCSGAFGPAQSSHSGAKTEPPHPLPGPGHGSAHGRAAVDCGAYRSPARLQDTQARRTTPGTRPGG